MQRPSPLSGSQPGSPSRNPDRTDSGTAPHAAGRRKAPSQSFLAVVVLPTLISILYFGVLAADRYQSEARFVIRNQMSSVAGQLSSLASSIPVGHTQPEMYIAHAFIKSREAVAEIAAETSLLEALAYPALDVFWRYPQPFLGHNKERLHQHFQSLISVSVDNTTGISRLTVQAFRPQDAEQIARTLINRAEVLINRLSTRSRSDSMMAAQRSAEIARQELRNAQEALTSFRLRHAVADPSRFFQIAQETQLELAKQSTLLSARLLELERAPSSGPQIGPLKVRLQALEAQSLVERQRLVSTVGSMGSLSSEYERLVLQRDFAENALMSASVALEAARVRTDRQRVHLEIVSQPTTTDRRAYPDRFLGIAGVWLICLCIYTIMVVMRDDLRSHSGQ